MLQTHITDGIDNNMKFVKQFWVGLKLKLWAISTFFAGCNRMVRFSYLN